MAKSSPFPVADLDAGKKIFNFWVSYFPVAPYFGVEWRFASMFMAKNTATAATPEPAAPAPAKSTVVKPVTTKPAAAAKSAAAEPAAEKHVGEALAEPESFVVEGDSAAQTAFALSPTPTDSKPANLLAVAPATPSDLMQIKGIGPKLEKMLNDLGVYTFEQISSFSIADLAWIDENLPSFKGRPMRDDWIGQAKALLT